MQGVWYRAATQTQAEKLGLDGWARNLEDGRVEVVVRGPEAAMATLCAWLWEGSPGAEVTGVSLEEYDASVPAGFTRG